MGLCIVKKLKLNLHYKRLSFFQDKLFFIKLSKSKIYYRNYIQGHSKSQRNYLYAAVHSLITLTFAHFEATVIRSKSVLTRFGFGEKLWDWVTVGQTPNRRSKALNFVPSVSCSTYLDNRPK
jgi:hypothetical protein